LVLKAGDRLQLGDRGHRRAHIGAAAGAVGLVVVVLGALALSERGIGGTISHEANEFTKPKLDRQNDPARVLRTNSGNRWVWWEEAVGGWADRPLAGYGAGSFPTTHLAYRQNSIEVRQPHSVPLELLTETGLVGAALALGGLALLGVAATRNLLARPMRCVASPSPARTRPSPVAACSSARTTLVPTATTRPPLARARLTARAVASGMR